MRAKSPRMKSRLFASTMVLQVVYEVLIQLLIKPAKLFNPVTEIYETI